MPPLGERSAASRAGPTSLFIALVLLGAVALAWPALYNGFPLVFSDSGTYLATLPERLVPIDRPLYYGAFIGGIARLLGIAWVPFVQALALSYVALLCHRWLAPSAPASSRMLAVTALALLSPLAWLCSWLMPDVLGGLVVIVPLMLLFGRRSLHPVHQAVVAVLLLVALLSHSGNILVYAAFAGAAAIVSLVAQRRIDLTAATLLVAIGATSVFLAMLPNATTYGRWTINPGAQAFVAARLAGDGVLQKFLARHCPAEPTLPLCDHQRELAGITNNLFLWDGKPRPLGDVAGAWNERASEFRELNARAVAENLGEVLEQAARNTASLLTRTEFGNDDVDPNLRAFDETTNVTRKIDEHFPRERQRYATSRQQQGALNLELVNRVHLLWTWTSYALLAFMGFVAWRRGERVLLAVVGLVFFALFLNALVHGALSGVYTRYQVKVSWIPTLVAFGCLAAFSRPRPVHGAAQAVAGGGR